MPYASILRVKHEFDAILEVISRAEQALSEGRDRQALQSLSLCNSHFRVTQEIVDAERAWNQASPSSRREHNKNHETSTK